MRVEEHIKKTPFITMNVCARVTPVWFLEEDNLTYLYDFDHEEITIYVQNRAEGIKLVEDFIRLGIWLKPTDEYRAFWASIFEECAGKWSRGNRAERAILQAVRVMYEWMDCDHEWVEMEISLYPGKSYENVLETLKYAIETILYGVAERAGEAAEHEDIREAIPDEVLMAANVLTILNQPEEALHICEMLAIELMQEKGITS